MPGRSRPWGEPVSNNTRYSSWLFDSLNSRHNDVDAVARGVARGDLVIYANFTDDEDENNPPNYASGYPPSPLLDEEVVTRTGEASRLRRRGALHGRRHQHSYTTLSCGVELPWRFKFETEDNWDRWNPKSQSSFSATSEFQRNGSVRSKKSSLDFPSTGCHAVLTTCAFIASHRHNVYTASESMDIVTAVDVSYLDEEQEEVVEQFLSNISSCCEWKPVACRQCGNVVGLRYWQTYRDENGNPLEDTYGRVTISRFAFFPSIVTSSKPYDFATEKYYSMSLTERLLFDGSPPPNSILRRPGNLDLRQPEVLYQDPSTTDPTTDPATDLLELPDPIQVRLPLASRNENNSILSRLQRLSSENILPSIPERSSSTSGLAQREENTDASWATWMPNPYIYSPEGENSETIERELEQRRLRLSEAISILQTTQDFVTNEFSDDMVDEAEPSVLETVPASTTEYSQQSSIPDNLGSGSLDEATQVANPHPYTHLSSSAPVPPSISTRTREVNRSDQQSNDGIPQLANDYLLPLTINPNASIGTHPMPTLLPISYDSPASISDIGASNQDTGEVESIGILVEVDPPPRNVTSSFGSAVVVPSLVDPNEHIQRHTLDYIHVTPPADCISSPSTSGQEDINSSTVAESENTSVEEPEDRYTDFDSKTDNLFNINAPRESPNPASEVYNLDLQSSNLTPFREYTPSLPPLSPGALATPSLPYSPTTSVPLPPTLLPLMEILDSIDMEVLPVARYSDLDDSGSGSGSDSDSETSDADSRVEDQDLHDESVYTTELPWDLSDSDSQWLNYEESPIGFQLPWSTELIDPVFPFSADENVPAEAPE